tara:strand:+ start:62 stop:247 length:186 start_codon:yes stop_codon:yes gene_type:complete
VIYKGFEIVKNTPHASMFSGPTHRTQIEVRNIKTGEWHDEFFLTTKEAKQHVDKASQGGEV